MHFYGFLYISLVSSLVRRRMEKGSLRLFLIISGPGTWSQQIIDFDYYTHGLLILIFNTHQKAKRKNE